MTKQELIDSFALIEAIVEKNGYLKLTLDKEAVNKFFSAVEEEGDKHQIEEDVIYATKSNSEYFNELTLTRHNPEDHTNDSYDCVLTIRNEPITKIDWCFFVEMVCSIYEEDTNFLISVLHEGY